MVQDLWASHWDELNGRNASNIALIIPEPDADVFHGDGNAQNEWEHLAIESCDVLMFWVPRDLETLPGFTTNVEFGYWLDTRAYCRNWEKVMQELDKCILVCMNCHAEIHEELSLQSQRDSSGG